jgi:hypothetical protein
MYEPTPLLDGRAVEPLSEPTVLRVPHTRDKGLSMDVFSTRHAPWAVVALAMSGVSLGLLIALIVSLAS